jgi:hypothetical protein
MNQRICCAAVFAAVLVALHPPQIEAHFQLVQPASWLVENNPDSGIPFTFEAWLRPMRDQQGGQCPVNNRWVGGTGRTGWVIFQRNPNLSYPLSEGHGWNFRMFSGQGSGGQDVLTDVDYSIMRQHLVVTWGASDRQR